MLPTNQTGFQGSRSKAVLKRITSMLSSHPNIFSFHLIHLEVHRDREDRENVISFIFKFYQMHFRQYYLCMILVQTGRAESTRAFQRGFCNKTSAKARQSFFLEKADYRLFTNSRGAYKMVR